MSTFCKVTRPGLVVLAIAAYMIAAGAIFTEEGAWTCVDRQDSIIELRSPGGLGDVVGVQSSRICARYGADVTYLALGIGMVSTAAMILRAFWWAAKPLPRRILIAAAAAVAVSSMGYAYTPSGLVAGLFSVSFLVLASIRNWELRQAGSGLG